MKIETFKAHLTARAGKDLISSLVSGLLTIGPRFDKLCVSFFKNFYSAHLCIFGGALDEAATTFGRASGALPAVPGEPHNLPVKDFITVMKKNNQLIMGIDLGRHLVGDQ